MTVAELIKELKTVDPKRLVVMSKDSEGNDYSPLSNVETCAYQAETTWYGDIGIDKLDEKSKKAGYTEDDVLTESVPALVLWPTN